MRARGSISFDRRNDEGKRIGAMALHDPRRSVIAIYNSGF